MTFGRSSARRGAVAAATVLAICAATLPAAQAAWAVPAPAAVAPTPEVKAQAQQEISLSGVGAGDHTITLVSGDRVQLTDLGGGRYGQRVQPASRPDGRIPQFYGDFGPDGNYLIPDDARAAVDAGRLDRKLFDIKYLAENGYADDVSATLPVIAEYPRSRATSTIRAMADALPASTVGLTLESVNANALTVTKSEAGTFWRSISGGQAAASTLSSGLTKLWLDQRVKATLAESVPLIGAPQAWAAGKDGTGVKVAVLDTGVDDTHADLAGKVAEQRSFVPGTSSAKDGHGHGTHVAATIAGSGAAMGGKYKGVAPGAQLMIGKVLSDSGSGDWSWIIEGMEWAATSGAKIVSMSLGSGPTDGTDLASRAVNDLTASTGTLFVIAAGNDGPAKQSVAAPGAADAALTVAATSKTDTLASFSSRGPRVDYALKPDIAAPGVNIVAARAAGTTMGTPLGDGYTTASGTSMATPHVAGAAAILAQAHPDWRAAQYKAALMSTSRDDGFTVYEQGAGRVDVARAAAQQLYASTPNVDFGATPGGQAPGSRELTYTNTGAEPVTLSLAPILHSVAGDSTPDGVLTVAGAVTVPARGTASVTVTVDSAKLAEGTYSGAIVATDAAGGIRLSTPVGLVREPPGVTLTINVPSTPGTQADGSNVSMLYSVLDVAGDLGSLGKRMQVLGLGKARGVVPVGTYSISVMVTWIDADLRLNTAILVKPEVAITGDTELAFDGPQAREFTFSSPKGPLEQFPSESSMTLQMERTVTPGNTWGSYTLSAPFTRLWSTPTPPVTKGKFLLGANVDLGHPEVQLSVTGPNKITLHPVNHPHYGSVLNGGFTDYRPFTGKQTLPLVNVGAATPEDISGLNLRGKLALLDNDLPCSLGLDRLHNVRDAGAVGVLAWTSVAQNVNCGGGPTIPFGVHPNGIGDRALGIPYTTLPPAEGRALRDQLNRGTVQIAVTGTPESPYRYSFQPREAGLVPASLHYTLDDRHVEQVDLELHAAGPGQHTVLHSARRPEQWLDLVGGPPDGTAPTTQRLYVGPLSAQVLHGLSAGAVDGDAYQTRMEVFDRPGRTQMRFFTGVATPGPVTLSDAAYRLADPDATSETQRPFAVCSFCRQGDTFYPIFNRVTADRTYDGLWVAPKQTHLYKDGQELTNGGPPLYGYVLPKEEANYRLTLSEGKNATEWTFTSGTATTETDQAGYVCPGYLIGASGPCAAAPLVFASYDLGDSQALDNKVPAGRSHRFQVNAFHSPSRMAMPKIAGIKLWTSTDDGKTWTSASIDRNQDGSYTAHAHYPKFADTTGAVSLKVEAWDTAGNRVTQTTTRAFGLADPRDR